MSMLLHSPLNTKGYIFSKQETLWGERQVVGFGDQDFCIAEIDRNLANKIIKENHYSKKFYAASYIHLGVFYLSELMGVLQYGYAMNPASQDSVVKETTMDEYLELNRMWLHDDLGKNSESRAISYSIKYIKKRFPKVAWIQSFADERCGKFGIVYQAANFEYYGEHTAIFWTLDDTIYHNSLMTRNPKLSKSAAILQNGLDRATKEELRQFRYIYWIKRKKRENVCFKVLPYPKHYKDEIAGI